jgi:outer membrane protein assembly factor BamA
VLDEGPTERATTGSTEAGFDADRRDDPYRPRRGYRLALASSTVFKRTTFRPDGGERATQLYAWLKGQQNFRVTPATGARLEVDGALRLTSEEVVPYYDLDPVGGATSLRGYREQEFRASRWAVARAEYGVFPAGGGRAFAFVDQGILYRPFLTTDGFADSETLYRIGYGAGFELPSGLGTVALSLGWGQGDGPLDGKLHVRLTNRF